MHWTSAALPSLSGFSPNGGFGALAFAANPRHRLYGNSKPACCVDNQTKPKRGSKSPKNSRDMTGKGHYGTGDFEISIKSMADFEIAKQYIEMAY